MTLNQKIIVASLDLGPRFALEELVVECWARWPEHFGLVGFHQKYPDSNVVICSLSGKYGPVKRGWLRRVAPKTYGLTPLGIEMARKY